jgi:hypothetical protein
VHEPDRSEHRPARQPPPKPAPAASHRINKVREVPNKKNEGRK